MLPGCRQGQLLVVLTAVVLQEQAAAEMASVMAARSVLLPSDAVSRCCCLC
jgi:hypothetical protein